MKLIIIEGARGTGKSSVTSKLRHSLKGSTLVNATGFSDDYWKGFIKITSYYEYWMEFLESMVKVDNQYVIFDRFFFSELVYSSLYKNYNFEGVYELFLDRLKELEPQIFLLTVNDNNELRKRLNRDKVNFHNVDESVEETLKQQEVYLKIFDNVESDIIDTSNMTTDDVYNYIMKSIIGDE